jgi:CO/xanthine dehydrogenase FAD-binding subunit
VTAASFTYQAPTRLEDALDALSSVGDSAAILAGGQGLVPMMLRRERRPSVLIDINRLPHLADIRLTPGGIVMGALVRLEQARRSPIVRRLLPVLADALSFVANPTIRARGTVVGNLVQNATGSELPAVALALDVRFITARGTTRREAYATALPLPPETIVTHVVWTMPEQAATDAPRGGFWEVAGRDGHRALVGAAVALGGGAGCRIALCGLGERAFRATKVEAAVGAALPFALDPDAISAALALDLDARFAVYGDGFADAAYRRDVAPVVIHRALHRALVRTANG